MASYRHRLHYVVKNAAAAADDVTIIILSLSLCVCLCLSSSTISSRFVTNFLSVSSFICLMLNLSVVHRFCFPAYRVIILFFSSSFACHLSCHLFLLLSLSLCGR